MFTYEKRINSRESQMYQVTIKKKAAKRLQSLQQSVKEKFAFLVRDLEETGPVQPSWMNYSKLSDGNYHCHLDYHHVACWTCEDGTITIEVYYVGSREGAPY